MISPQFARLDSLYANTGIESRRAVEAREWYMSPHSWEERSEAFQRHAVDLLEEAAGRAIAEAGLDVDDIDAIVVNTITGIAVPSLDALLINRMKFRPDIERLPIFGFGCGGGVAGLSRAARLATAMPDANVLFLTIDLCSLCLRVNDPGVEMFVSAALFGDGAAAIVLSSRGGGDEMPENSGPRALANGEYFWPGTERIMGWDMKGDGFGVVLSPELAEPDPHPLRRGAAELPGAARPGHRRFRRFPVSSRRPQGTGDGRQRARPHCPRPQAFLESAPRFRQHVVGDRAVRACRGDPQRRARPPFAGGVRAGFFRLFHGAGALGGSGTSKVGLPDPVAHCRAAARQTAGRSRPCPSGPSLAFARRAASAASSSAIL